MVEKRADLKKLIPELKNFLSDNAITQLNSKCTRHRLGQRSSLLDVYFTNATLKCSQWENIVNLTSEHEAVKVNFRVTDRIHKKQFIVLRNHKNLNSTNITKILEAHNYFENEMNILIVYTTSFGTLTRTLF